MAVFDPTSFLALSPEITLFVTTILTLLADMGYRNRRPRLVTAITLVGMGLAFIFTIITSDHVSALVLSHSLNVDRISQFVKGLLIFSSFMTVLLGWMSQEIHRTEKAELYALVALSTLGMCLLVSAEHFLLLFLAYEMMSGSSYVLAAFKRNSKLSSEAGMKLFVHGALTSILFAFGIVMLFGIARSFHITDIRTQLAQHAVNSEYLWIAFGLIFAAIAARMAVFPFHFLAPDIYEGSPSPVSAFLSASTNIAAMAFAIRICIEIFSAKGDMVWIPREGFDWPQLMTGVAAVTMTIGNLTALYQTNLKRLIGYSCIAQMGYFLMGLAVSNAMGITSVLFSLAGYVFMTLGAFFIIQMVTDHMKNENVTILRGLVWKNPYEAVLLCIFLLGLAGLPPFIGFVGRFYLLGTVVKQKLYWLAIIAAINWVIGLTYYLSMIRQIFAPRAEGEEATIMNTPAVAHGALVVLVLPTLALGIYWDPIINYITRSLGSVSW